MSKKSKLDLKELEVQSFVTTIENNTLRGGGEDSVFKCTKIYGCVPYTFKNTCNVTCVHTCAGNCESYNGPC